MKHLTITLLTLLMSMGTWAEEDMISIDDYLNEQTNLDENNLYYVYSRCSAINYKVNGLSKNSEKFKESLANPSLLGFEKFYGEAGVVLMRINENTLQENKENLRATVTGMIDEYTTISNKLYLKTGSYFTDLMVADLSICNQLQKDFD